MTLVCGPGIPDNPLYGLDPVELGVALSQLPVTHDLVAAARLAVETVDARYAEAREHCDVQRDVGEAWREAGGAERVAGNERMWNARGTAARESAEAAREEAGDAPTAHQAAEVEEVAERADREAEQAEAHATPWVPDPRSPSGAELRPETETTIGWAREWVDQQEQAEHERYDYACGYDQAAEERVDETADSADDAHDLAL